MPGTPSSMMTAVSIAAALLVAAPAPASAQQADPAAQRQPSQPFPFTCVAGRQDDSYQTQRVLQLALCDELAHIHGPPGQYIVNTKARPTGIAVSVEARLGGGTTLTASGTIGKPDDLTRAAAGLVAQMFPGAYRKR